NVQGLRSSAFGLKSNELFNEFKGRGWTPRERAYLLKKRGTLTPNGCPGVTQGTTSGMESLSGLKLNIQIILNLLEEVKIIYGLSLKKKKKKKNQNIHNTKYFLMHTTHLHT